jgi:putative DNA primase/helicase
VSGRDPDAVARDADRIVRQLGGKWHGDYAMCRCPAHADGDPSLSVRVGQRAVLFHCFAGCTSDAIVDALRTGNFAAARDHDPGQRHEGGKGDFNKLALSIWRFADPFAGSLAERYLRTRAITPVGINARFDARCQFGAGDEKAFAPALIVPVEEDAGVVAIHRTFLRADGADKAEIIKPKRMLGNPGGGAVRWGGIPANGVLRLAEGVEEAASVMNMLEPETFVWPVLGIERYQTLNIPESIHTIIIYSQHGAEAARAVKRAAPHLTANDRQLSVKLPPHAGDWNDLLREIRAQ